MARSVKMFRWMPPIPMALIYLGLIGVVLSWVPLALVALKRTSKTEKPPIHIFQDMDVQPKLKAQAFNETFADGRAMRPRLEGAVARGRLFADDHMYRGYRPGQTIKSAAGADEPAWYVGYPDGVVVDMALLERGRERYNIFCAPCHSETGDGQGMINRRAITVGAAGTGWVQPTNLHLVDEKTGKRSFGEALYPNGKLFNTITHGARTMKGYASQVPAEDRWAIIAYVRALQISQGTKLDELPAEDRAKIKQ